MTLLSRVRHFILLVLVLGMSGTLVELLLLSHYEGPAQIIPLALIGFGLAVAAWHAARPTIGTVRALQGLMGLFVLAGGVGVGLHFNGAAEFQREIDPSQRFVDLFPKVIRSHAPPMLAPGVMVQLGLLGLIYAYRHPAMTPGGLRDARGSGDPPLQTERFT